MIGRVKVNNKEFSIRQDQHATVGGEYEIQDMDKRAELEAEREKLKKGDKK